MGSPGVAGGSAGPFGDGRRGEVPGKALQRTEHPRGSCCSTAAFSAQPPKCPGSSGKFGPGCAHALLGQRSPNASAPQRGACVPGPIPAPGFERAAGNGPALAPKSRCAGAGESRVSGCLGEPWAAPESSSTLPPCTAGGCSWEALQGAQRQRAGDGESGRGLGKTLLAGFGGCVSLGWQQELVLWGSGAGRGTGAADGRGDRGQAQGAARRRPRRLGSKWDLACADPAFWHGPIP